MVFADTFTEVAAVLVVAAGIGALAFWSRQPLIIAFILSGIILGPAGLDWVRAYDQVDLFAKLGIGLLLFVVGLKLDPHLIRSVGPVAAVAGIVQMIVTAMLGFGAATVLGLSTIHAFYVAAATMFSSTVIIVKLLSDKKEIDSLHGRIALGILIMQDIVVILLMIGVTAFGPSGEQVDLGMQMLAVVGKGIAFLTLIALTTRYALPGLMHSLARWPELLTLFAIAWAIGLASLGTGLGFSKEVGAFVAGVALASTPYKAILGARLATLRDFLLLFFFIDLGVQIDIGHLGEMIVPALFLSAIVVVGKPMIVAAMVSRMGYAQRTAITSGLNMGQISEFSLIFAALGMSLGHINESTMGLITLIGLITIGLSTYMILYSKQLYKILAPSMTPLLGSGRRAAETPIDALPRVDTIVFGLGRYGRNLVQELERRGRSVLGIDYDPERVRVWRDRGLATLYGDLEDPELFHSLPLGDAEWVISTIPGQNRSQILLHTLQHDGYAGYTAVTAESFSHRQSLIADGADVVLLPFRDAAAEAADKLALYSSAATPG